MRWSEPSLRSASLAFALALLLPLLGSCGASSEAPPPPQKPRVVVLIVVDTLRKDHLGSYGYASETSPNIDRLASDGTLYRSAISQAPWTTPSLGALMTSRYPSTLGILSDRSRLEPSFVTLAELLRGEGYRTGAAISHTFCSSDWNFDQGFESFDESNILPHNGLTSPGVTERGLEMIEAWRDEPFFLWLHYFDPHATYVRHDGLDPSPSTGYDGPIGRETRNRHVKALLKAPLRDEDIAEAVRNYDSEIAMTDQHVGRVLERLRELDLYDDALIVFTADHGEEFADHGGFGHAHTLYQELVNVPLIIKYPSGESARQSPAEVSEPVALLDVYPTIRDLLGLPVDDALAGTTLLGAPAAERTIFTETSRNETRLRAAVSGRHKVVFDGSSQAYAYFDLTEGETSVDAAHANEAPAWKRLRETLDAWALRQDAAASVAGDVELSDEEASRLGELGYGE